MKNWQLIIIMSFVLQGVVPTDILALGGSSNEEVFLLEEVGSSPRGLFTVEVEDNEETERRALSLINNHQHRSQCMVKGIVVLGLVVIGFVFAVIDQATQDSEHFSKNTSFSFDAN